MNAESERVIKEECTCFGLSNIRHEVIINRVEKTQGKEKKEAEGRGVLSQAQFWTGNMEHTAVGSIRHMRVQRRNTYFWVKGNKCQL